MCDSFHDFKGTSLKNIYRLWLGKKFRNDNDYRKMLDGDPWWERGEKAEELDQDKLQDNEMFNTIPLNQWFNDYMNKPCGMTAYNLALKDFLKTAGVIPIDADEKKTDIYLVKDVMTKQSTQTLNDVINYVLDKGKINTINTNTIATIMDTGSGARNPDDNYTCKKPMKITLILPGTREITAEYTVIKNGIYRVKINFEYMSKIEDTDITFFDNDNVKSLVKENKTIIIKSTVDKDNHPMTTTNVKKMLNSNDSRYLILKFFGDFGKLLSTRMVMDTECIKDSGNVFFITGDKVSGRISDIVLPITYNVYNRVDTFGGYNLRKTIARRLAEGSLQTGVMSEGDTAISSEGSGESPAVSEYTDTSRSGESMSVEYNQVEAQSGRKRDRAISPGAIYQPNYDDPRFLKKQAVERPIQTILSPRRTPRGSAGKMSESFIWSPRFKTKFGSKKRDLGYGRMR